MKEFKQETQVAGSEVMDARGVVWTVLKDILFTGYQIAEPSEGEYYKRVDYGQQISNLSFTIKEALEGLVVRMDKLDERVAVAGEPLSFNTSDFKMETDLAGNTTIRIIR